MTGRRVAIGLVALGALLGACGGDSTELAAPAPVPDGLVPDEVHDGAYAFHASDLAVDETFAEAGPSSLAADGELWELRTGDRLVGVLQLTTLLPKVELERTEHRDPIVRQLLPTARDRFDVGEITVWSAQRSGKTTYLWFGEGMFSLLTVKPGSNDDLDPEQVLTDIIDHMVATEAWQYAHFEEEDE